jgi:hypothetical protein
MSQMPVWVSSIHLRVAVLFVAVLLCYLQPRAGPNMPLLPLPVCRQRGAKKGKTLKIVESNAKYY